VDVLQAAERIVFAVDEEEGTVETHVQISYEGAAEEFAWVVPVSDVPELFVSTDRMFESLELWTRPRFVADYFYEDCYGGGDTDTDTDSDSDADTGWDSGVDTAAHGPPPVVVVAQELVGPYETVVLTATTSAALISWLVDNGYALPAAFGPKLSPYVASGAYFVALRLSNGRSAGDIAPLGMRYQGTQPAIPITITSVAATEDMRLEVYVFGDRRAVPENYLHVQINEAAVDWVMNANYDAVITDAANEAGGQAFATDFSGSPSMISGSIIGESQFDRLNVLRFIDNPVVVVTQVMSMVPRGDEVLLSLLRSHLPLPADLSAQGLTDLDFYNCLSCYSAEANAIPFSGQAFVDDVREMIVEPLEHAEELIATHSKLTRLRSSMSPDEMTVEPQFTFNDTMPDVDNIRTAAIHVECDGRHSVSDAPLLLELDDGQLIPLPSLSEIYADPEAYFALLSGTSAVIVEETGSRGLPNVLVDLSPQPPAVQGSTEEVSDVVASCGGCAAGGSRALGVSSTLGLLVVLVGRRRRS